MAKQMIAVIGAGGKTTAMAVLTRQCRERSVLVTTTTHIFPMALDHCRCCLIGPAPEELTGALSEPGIVCAGTGAAQGKLTALPDGVLQAGIAAADVVLYEGDGSRRMPLKLHQEGEPVLLPGTTKYLVVAGLTALGKPVADVVHRYETAPDLGSASGGCVGTEDFAHCVLETVSSIGCGLDQIRIFLNQEDNCREMDKVQEILEVLGRRGLPVRSGSLRTPPDNLYEWITNG